MEDIAQNEYSSKSGRDSYNRMSKIYSPFNSTTKYGSPRSSQKPA